MIHNISRAIILDQNKLLLVYNPEQKDPYFYLPGGHIEEKETALQALKRELKEETGLETYPHFRYLGCLEHIFEEGADCTCHSHEYSFCFLTESPDLSASVTPPRIETHVGFYWAPLEELSSLKLLTPSLPLALEVWLDSAYQESFFHFEKLAPSS